MESTPAENCGVVLEEDGRTDEEEEGLEAQELAVFFCISCCPDGDAGVSKACSMSCRNGHFHCDCGNLKFGIGVCKLYGSKDTDNGENVYNPNFKKVYCLCKRPYPDPDVAVLYL